MTSNLPERQSAILASLDGQAALFEDPQQVMALSASELRMVGVEIAQAVRPRLAEMRRYVGLVAWAMRAKVPAGEYGKWAEGYAEMVGISIRTLGEWRSKVEAVNPYQSPRKTAGQSTQLAETAETSKPIPAASTEAPAKSSEGGGTVGDDSAVSQRRPPSGKSSAGGLVSEQTPSPPAGPSSGGADVQPPAGPTGEAPTSPPSAPPGPSAVGEDAGITPVLRTPSATADPSPGFAGTATAGFAAVGVGFVGDPPERPPSDRQLAARVIAHLQEVDPTDAGPVLTPTEATFLRQWAQRTLDAWKAKHAPPAAAEKPQRRQGTITRPQGAVVAGRAIEQRSEKIDGHEDCLRPGIMPARFNSTPAPKTAAKRHALDCSCLGCKPAKAVAK